MKFMSASNKSYFLDVAVAAATGLGYS